MDEKEKNYLVGDDGFQTTTGTDSLKRISDLMQEKKLLIVGLPTT